MASEADSQVQVPRVAIRFCTQCKWNLRAAYYAQELLQTFSTSLGEVALIPVSGGIFTVTMIHSSQVAAGSDAQGNYANSSAVVETLLWDRKAEGGFPETKELKNRVRNVIEPGRDLGHVDRSLKKQQGQHDMNNGVSKEVQPLGPGSGGDVGVARPHTEPESKKDSRANTVAQGADAEGNAESKTGCEDCR